MVTVTFFRGTVVDDSKTASRIVPVGFEVRGHADFDARGIDIVCAGVSAIAQSALLGLTELLGGKVRAERRPGFLSFSMSVEQAGSDGAHAIIRSMELGLLSLERVHPKNVRVEYRDENE